MISQIALLDCKVTEKYFSIRILFVKKRNLDSTARILFNDLFGMINVLVRSKKILDLEKMKLSPPILKRRSKKDMKTIDISMYKK